MWIYLLVTFKSIADHYCVHLSTVANIWINFCDKAQVDPNPKGGDRCSKRAEGDLELVEILKSTQGKRYV